MSFEASIRSNIFKKYLEMWSNFYFFIRSRVSKEIGKKIGREGGKEKMTENKIIVRYVHKVQTSKSFDGWTRYSVRWTI